MINREPKKYLYIHRNFQQLKMNLAGKYYIFFARNRLIYCFPNIGLNFPPKNISVSYSDNDNFFLQLPSSQFTEQLEEKIS